MEHPNPATSWACVPLLAPKDGPAMLRFTVDLGPFILFIIKHKYPMSNTEQELCELFFSYDFETFDLSHGY